jgi:hypothetical protein
MDHPTPGLDNSGKVKAGTFLPPFPVFAGNFESRPAIVSE